MLRVVLHFSFVPAWLLTGAMSLVAFPPLNGLCSCNLIKDLTSSPHGYKHNPCTHSRAHIHAHRESPLMYFINWDCLKTVEAKTFGIRIETQTD